MKRSMFTATAVMFLGGLAAYAGKKPTGGSTTTNGPLAGAGFTTALDNAVCSGGTTNNCNIYQNKADVYLSGGPVSAGLAANRKYFFAVLTPGTQNGSFVDGATGNLHDATKDPQCNRSFKVTSTGDVVYPLPASENADCYNTDGTAKYVARTVGSRTDGKKVLPAMPYASTTNNGGVYILAICDAAATSPNQCKYDAFKVRECTTGRRGTTTCKYDDKLNVITGVKYYDGNHNGVQDTGEVTIGGWPIEMKAAVGLTSVIVTGADGTFAVNVPDDTYKLQEMNVWTVPFTSPTKVVDSGAANDPAYYPKIWYQTSSPTIYSVTASGGSTSSVAFGNVCLGTGGGHTPGGWSNANTSNDDTCQEANFGETSDLLALTALPLVHTDATALDFCTSTDASSCDFLKLDLNTSMNASNMAAMLSRHLGAAVLNTNHSGDTKTRFGIACTTPFPSRSSTILAPGVTSADALGFATLGDVIDEATAELTAHPCTTANGSACGSVASVASSRAYQTALKNALAAANEDRNFVQATYNPAVCAPPPVSTLQTTSSSMTSGAPQSL